MSLLIFSQTFGGALFLAFAQTVFNSGLSSEIGHYAPSVSVVDLQAAGATGIRGVVEGQLLGRVLEAYDGAVVRVFFLAAGAAAGAGVSCLGMGWKSIKAKVEKGKENEEAQVEKSATEKPNIDEGRPINTT